MTFATDRRDTIAIKIELANLLGESGPQYWAAFKEFLGGKIKREKFDAQVSGILKGKAATLHNNLIIGLIHNAQKGVLPPAGPKSVEFAPVQKSNAASSQETTLKRRQTTGDLVPAEARKKMRIEQIMSLSQSDRLRLMQLKVAPRLTVPKPVKPSFEGLSFPHASYYCCEDEGDIPSKEDLRERMRLIGHFNQIANISDESVEILYRALSDLMKDTMSLLMQKLTTSEDAAANREGTAASKPAAVDVKIAEPKADAKPGEAENGANSIELVENTASLAAATVTEDAITESTNPRRSPQLANGTAASPKPKSGSPDSSRRGRSEFGGLRPPDRSASEREALYGPSSLHDIRSSDAGFALEMVPHLLTRSASGYTLQEKLGCGWDLLEDENSLPHSQAVPEQRELR
ncbi:transcriptional regulator of RNA polII, SAGA, subunit-domain-containing protein [Polychytrium aggregatum]|uniref:transcriptional regulator of RNA polII, SAGA, subunit-domain-containing protein n=1 Tax=Polychytrium aggregatum TaxID=110093 RepID=UPI0022FEE60B|nr:transcriptional regulator of RNA polII, SAGA, subunit-domain-containing protein [Polychytrium aggregatum]KAI9207291.1 transcriptional regulator of RNA polII, SAGA, subunit-domain-containing protein [Polychytrium aggregatum]